MKFLTQKAEVFIQEKGVKGLNKHIERCGRICYRSEDKITETSAKPFVNKMIKSNHLAMVEHGTIFLKFIIGSPIIDADKPKIELKNFFTNNHFSRVVKVKYKENGETITDLDARDYVKKFGPCNVYYVTTNYRVLIENELVDKCKKFVCEYEPHHINRITVHLVTDRGVWNECIRHREIQRTDDCANDLIYFVDYSLEQNMSFAQESTRFCNYLKDKFGKELSFIIPDWADRSLVNYYYKNYTSNSLTSKIKRLFHYFSRKENPEEVWVSDMQNTEKDYFELLSHKIIKPENARTVLNNSLKTEIVMTGFVDETGWKHFFDLRFKGTTGKPQPEIQSLSGQLYKEFIDLNLIEKEENE